MKDFMEKHGRENVFRISFGAFAVIFIALIVSAYGLNHSYHYKGHKLKILTVGKSGVEMTDPNGNRLVMSVDSLKITFLNMECTIRYLNETISYKSDFDSAECVYIFSDGSSLTESIFSVQFGYEGNGDGPSVSLSETQIAEKLLVSKLLDYYNDNQTIDIYIAFAILGLLLLLAGTGIFFYPESFWRFQTMFMVKNGEPTDWAILSNMIVGAMLVAAAYIGIFYIF